MANFIPKSTNFLNLSWRNKPVSVEYTWVGNLDSTLPVMIFLHEGLGSVSMWRNFPDELCKLLGVKGLVYSRPAYGLSTPRDPEDLWDVDFLHQQALEVLPRLLEGVEIGNPVWLFGHSDGGSIALLAGAHYPNLVAGIIVVAPHLFVEDLTIQSIVEAKNQYCVGGLRERLSRYHADVDSAFYGWNSIWLKPEFKYWSIEGEVSRIKCPILAIQGRDDLYGTMDQVRKIKTLCNQAVIEEIQNCGHSPHKDQKDALIRCVKNFFINIDQRAKVQ